MSQTTFQDIPIEIHELIGKRIGLHTLCELKRVCRFTNNAYNSKDIINISAMHSKIISMEKELFLPELIKDKTITTITTSTTNISERIFIYLFTNQVHIYTDQQISICFDYAVYQYSLETITALFSEFADKLITRDCMDNYLYLPIMIAPDRNNHIQLLKYMDCFLAPIKTVDVIKQTLLGVLIYTDNLDLLRTYYPEEDFSVEIEMIKSVSQFIYFNTIANTNDFFA